MDGRVTLDGERPGAGVRLDLIGLCPECGRVIVWCSGREEYLRMRAWYAANAVRQGLDLRSCTTDEARSRGFGHVDGCHRRPRPKAGS